MNVRLLYADVVLAQCILKPGQASSRVGKMLRSCDRGYFEVTKLNEMLGGEFGAAPVVDDNRIDIVQARLAIEVDQYCAGFLESAQEIQIRSGRAIDDAGNFSIQEQLESGFLFGAIFVGVADEDGVSVGSGLVLDRFDDSGKEEISDIGNDDADGSGLLGAQRARRPVGGVTMAMDGGEDTLAGQGSNIFRATESPRNRRDAQIQLSGEIVECHKRRAVGPTVPVWGDRGLGSLTSGCARTITGCKVLHCSPTADRGNPGRFIESAE